jgi:hypothetical protein
MKRSLKYHWSQRPQIYVVFQDRKLVAVILDGLFKTEKSDTQWYSVIPLLKLMKDTALARNTG